MIYLKYHNSKYFAFKMCEYGFFMLYENPSIKIEIITRKSIYLTRTAY